MHSLLIWHFFLPALAGRHESCDEDGRAWSSPEGNSSRNSGLWKTQGVCLGVSSFVLFVGQVIRCWQTERNVQNDILVLTRPFWWGGGVGGGANRFVFCWCLYDCRSTLKTTLKICFILGSVWLHPCFENNPQDLCSILVSVWLHTYFENSPQDFCFILVSVLLHTCFEDFSRCLFCTLSIWLQTYFEDNPRDLQVLRHNKALGTARMPKTLKNVPDYAGRMKCMMSACVCWGGGWGGGSSVCACLCGTCVCVCCVLVWSLACVCGHDCECVGVCMQW